MKFLYACLCVAAFARAVLPAPIDGFVFPDARKEKKLEPIITPPVLPILEHLERDPSTLINEPSTRTITNQVKPKFFGGGFDVSPSGNGGLTASVSSSFGGPGSSASHSAAQSFSFGFNEGFGASHSGSQSSSFGFGSFSGSQASSQASAFTGPGGSGSGAASSASSIASSFNTGGGSGSQSASQAFGFNSLGGFGQPEPSFGDGLLDIRHRGIPNFPFPPSFGRGKSIGAASFRKSIPSIKNADDFVSVFITN